MNPLPELSCILFRNERVPRIIHFAEGFSLSVTKKSGGWTAFVLPPEVCFP